MSFSLQVGAFAKAVGIAVDQVQKKFAMDILAAVVYPTPVDSGRAKGNWQVSVGAPASGVIDKADKNGQSTVAAGNKVIAGAKPGRPIFIANNLPYIWRLENGWSKQAPVGWVAATMASAQQYLDGAVAKAKAQGGL